MHSVCRCSLPVWRRSFLKKGTPRDLFLPRPGYAPGRIWPKNNNTCKGPWVLHPYQVSSKSIKRFWRRSRKCEKFTDGRTTDGRTDDGRCAMTIAHSSLRLRWANKVHEIHFACLRSQSTKMKRTSNTCSMQFLCKQETAKDSMAGLQSRNKTSEDWQRTSLTAMVILRYCMTLTFE